VQLLDEVEQRYGTTAALAMERTRLRGERVQPNGVTSASADVSSWEYWSLGRALMHAGELDRAYEVLRSAESLQEAMQRRNPLSRQTADFWATFYRGLCDYRRGRFSEAAFAFYRVPVTAQGHYFAGLAQIALKQYDAALEELDRALEQLGFAEAFLERGVLRCLRNEPKLALTDLGRALDLGATPARAHYYTAVAHRALGDRAAARAAVQKALQLNPAYAEAKTLAKELDEK
jgi:tetratricopeptide (TPR) repeat protein